jgi:hypothetical protein
MEELKMRIDAITPELLAPQPNYPRLPAAGKLLHAKGS